MDLHGERLIMLPSAYAVRSLFDQTAHDLGVQPDIRIEMNSLEGILATVRSCDGATVLPALALPKKEKALRAIRFKEPVPKRAVGLIWRRDAYRSKAAEAFAKVARTVVSEHAGQVGWR